MAGETGRAGLPPYRRFSDPADLASRPVHSGRVVPGLAAAKPREIYLIEEVPICLDQAAFRIALRTDALLVPAAVRSTGSFRFRITFGRPVPRSLMNKESATEANLHLLRELWPGLKEDPSNLTWTTLEALAPDSIGSRGIWP